jgi:DNA-binding NarL/FixJ family response regulator
MKLRVVVAHNEILYKQALARALSLFDEIIVVGEARYYEEILEAIEKNGPEFVVADKKIFGHANRIEKLARAYPKINFIILTTKHEDLINNQLPNVQYFLTLGYLVDLLRLIMLTAENKKFAQPALIKNVLSNIKKLEESGISTDTLFLEFDQKKISIIIDLILGKSFDDICYSQRLTPEELNKEIEIINNVIQKLIKSVPQLEGK